VPLNAFTHIESAREGRSFWGEEGQLLACGASSRASRILKKTTLSMKRRLRPEEERGVD